MKNLNAMLAFLLLWGAALSAQPITQTIRGQVLDKQTMLPLAGATVQVMTLETPRGGLTDAEGRFRLGGIPLGRHDLRVRYFGYEAATVANLVLVSGREAVVEVLLEEAVVTADEVVLTAGSPPGSTVNEMAAVSARAFSLEEVTRFSGGRQDVARLAANFAGVSTSNDSRNDLVIRGNSPAGVLWRMEGVAIPSPNHYATLGTTGGPVSALNTNLLKNSDFLTAAFPAEYGNATAGVFDIRLRNGNDERHEFTGQVGFNGFEALAEGPLNRAHRGSFVASYRYSVIGLLGSVVDIGTSGIPKYQDLSFKVNLGSYRRGSLSLFGLGATSDIAFYASETDSTDFYASQGLDSYAGSDLGILGANHTLLLDEKTYLRTVLSVAYAGSRFDADRIEPDSSAFRVLRARDLTKSYTLSSLLNRKFSARHSLRAGIIATYYDLDLRSEAYDDAQGAWSAERLSDEGLFSGEAYAQSQYKASPSLTLDGGAHLLYLSLNGDVLAEPRMSVSWQPRARHRFSAGYGLHGQQQPFPVYFLRSEGEMSNEGLRFTRSHHWVAGYDLSIAEGWRLKAETYYQRLSRVPVEQSASSFSMLNAGSDFTFPSVPNLVNEGQGRNYGAELTLEKFYSKGYYGLLTLTLYDSKYKGSDGIERNTAFNNRFVGNLLAGKEFSLGKQGAHAFTLDVRAAYAGGRYYTPVDLEASRAAGAEVRDESRAFSERYPSYFRADVKIGFRSSLKRFSQTFSIDFQNVSGNKNVFLQRFDPASGQIVTSYQLGFFPDVTYRIQF